MTNIITRLRDLTDPRFSSIPVAEVMAEAANEISRLRSENAVLRGTIEELNSDLSYWAGR